MSWFSQSLESETTIANLMTRPIEIRYEQAVYGSFPFWDRGYSILAHSPGCRPEWLVGLRAACQNYGERPAGVSESSALFALKLEAGPWMIVGVSPQGVDDRGRPGALAFHALFLDPHDYRQAGANPFNFAPLLRNDWTAETETLATGVHILGTAENNPPHITGTGDSQLDSIAATLKRGGRVALQAPAPIGELAGQVWNRLPLSVRSRVSMATWAFGNGNHFDLVALPRLVGVEFDASYVDLTEVKAHAESPTLPFEPAEFPARPWRTTLQRAMPILGLTALLFGMGLGIVFRPEHKDEPVPILPQRAVAPSTGQPPPDPARYPSEHVDLEETRRVTEGLVTLAEQFGLEISEAPSDQSPATLMTTLATRLRYHGPWLTPAELVELEDDTSPEPSRDRSLALAWHAQIRRFAPDRTLPASFPSGPLRWQLDTLAWSFHLDEMWRNPTREGQRSLAEIPHALAQALALDISLRETPLVAHHPALASYRAFLGRLPRR